jgi:transcriptional regulator with XRE-family HTH domain
MQMWQFGRYIQKLLEERDWTITKLASKAGMSHVYLGNLIRGENPNNGKQPKTSIDTLVALSKALKIPESKLLLAYKGIDPDDSKIETLSSYDLYGIYHITALGLGCNIAKLPDNIRQQYEDELLEGTKQFIALLTELQVRRLKK